jgi:hypothetical protein
MRQRNLVVAAALALTPACKDGSGALPDGGMAAADGAPPVTGKAPLVINELMARNRLSLVDDSGGRPDWIELYNPTTQSVSLEGWSVTDRLDEPTKVALAAELVVPAQGYLVLYADGAPDLGPAHLALRLRREGGQFGLVAPDGALIDGVTYGHQATDLAAARTPDGADHWEIVWAVSPGQPNPDPGAGQAEASADGAVIPAAGDLSDQLLGEGAVVELELELSADAIASLRARPRTYVAGALTYRGRRLDPIGVRLKGQNSFQPIDQKPSLRIKIDRYVPGAELFGLDDLVLNNMSSDPTMLHEQLAYKAMRLAGVPAPRANFAVVTINGEAYGLYTHLENIEARMLARWFADPTGPLFEATDVDFTIPPPAPGAVIGNVDGFEHEGGPDDRSALIALAEVLQLPPAEAIAAANMVDMPQFKRYWAVCAVIGQFDAFPFSYDDYYVYVDPRDRLIRFLPWGMDETFAITNYWVLAGESLLPDHCQHDDPCRLSIVDEIAAVLDLLEGARFVGEFDIVKQQAAPLIAADPRRAYTDAEVAAAQAFMREFIAGRRSFLEGNIPTKF